MSILKRENYKREVRKEFQDLLKNKKYGMHFAYLSGYKTKLKAVQKFLHSFFTIL